MKDEDIVRLSKGIKLKKDLASMDRQIENVKEANIIKIFKTGWEKSQQINYDIPIEGHPYSDEAKSFIDAYIEYLKQRKINIQTEFDNL